MRIISGEFRGRNIVAPQSFDLRPTTDMAKEGLFNILNNEFDFSEINVLDLFSGIGCSDVVAVEKNPRHVAFIKQTAQQLKVSGLKVLNLEVRSFLKLANREFSLVFADPPYDLPWLADIPNLIFESKAVNENSLIVVEHPGTYDFSEHTNFVRLAKYGKVHFSFFRIKK